MTTDAKTRILRLLALRETPRPQTPRVQLAAILVAAMVVGASVALAQRGGVEKPEPGTKETNAATAANDDHAAKRKDDERFVYVLEPPDTVQLQGHRLVPKGPQRIEKLDALQLDVLGTVPEGPIKGIFTVDADGEINLGAVYGRVSIAGLTVKEATKAIDKQLREHLSEPQVSVSIADKWKKEHFGGLHTIGPDGYLNLGAFGTVYVSGLTLDEGREAIEKKLGEHYDQPSIALTIHAHNSKVYYVIVEGNGNGDNITRYPWNGSENVLDGIAQQKDLLIRKDTKIWIARPVGDKFEVLNIDWAKLKSGEISPRRFRLIPGDRIFVSGASWKSSAAETAKGNRS